MGRSCADRKAAFGDRAVASYFLPSYFLKEQYMAFAELQASREEIRAGT
jgi:hypothetical protein